MKVYVVFESNEEPQARLAMKAVDWYLLVWDLDQWLRSKIKYPEEHMASATQEMLQEVRDQLHLLMRERGVSLEDMP